MFPRKVHQGKTSVDGKKMNIPIHKKSGDKASDNSGNDCTSVSVPSYYCLSSYTTGDDFFLRKSTRINRKKLVAILFQISKSYQFSLS